MKRKDWLLILLPLLTVWWIDHLSKLWVTNWSKPFSFGFLRLEVMRQQSVLWDLFKDTPPMLKSLSLINLGGLIIFAFGASQYLWPMKSNRMRIGISLGLGGFTANLFDPMLRGISTQFIYLDLPLISNAPWNLADFFQWIGLILVAITLAKREPIFWPQHNNRKRLWINPDYQFRYISLLLVLSLGLTLMGGLFSYGFLKLTLKMILGEATISRDHYLVPFIFNYVSMSLTFCCFLVFIGRKVSHRSAGPIYAFDKYVDDLLEGRNRRFLLRAGDEFKQLEITGRKIADYLLENHLIDTEDNVKVLTTQEDNAEDFSVLAVPVIGQNPDYSSKATSITSTLLSNARKIRSDCPLCLKQSLVHYQSLLAPNLIECIHCHFVFNPSPLPLPRGSENLVFDMKTLNSHALNALKFEHPIYLKIAKSTFNQILHLRKDLKSYLDIGARSGAALDFAKQINLEVVHGMESSVPASEILRKKGFTIFRGASEIASIAPSTYDLISLNDTLARIENPTLLISQCHRWLKPDGIISINTPNKDSLVAKVLKSFWLPARQHPHAIFSEDNLRNLLINGDFKILSFKHSSRFVTLGSLLEDLKIYGLTWPEFFIRVLPETALKTIIFPFPSGYMTTIAQRVQREPLSLNGNKTSNL